MEATEFTVGKYPATLLLNILTDGCEGGMMSWAQVEEYKWEWWYKTDLVDNFAGDEVNTDLINPDTALLKIRRYDYPGEHGEFVDITLNKLAEATDWALETYSDLFSWHTNNKGIRDDIDYDAVGADVIIQKIVLGEVVYG